MTTVAGTNVASLDGDMLAVSPDASVVNGNTAAVVEGASTTNESIPVVNGHKFTVTPAINGELPTTNGGARDMTERPVHVQDAAKELVHMDVVVVGAGFSGISAIYRLRKLGMKIRAFEAGSDFGGVWYWNRYPGARVDSETPFYQLNIPEVWQTWNFKQRFPDHVELREYCAHIDEVLGLRKDVEFDSRVNSVTYDNHTARWTVKTDKGHIATCKYVILATGLLHRRFIPDFPGLDSFEGEVHHSGFWPDNLSVKGKKVGLIGAGATAVQITQELGKQADPLTVFLRRPSYCLPMRQRSWSELENLSWKPFLERLFDIGRLSRAGFPTSGPACGVFDVTREERESWFEKLWERGAFNFLMGNYNDVLLDRKANREIYNFWQKKTAERLKDPAKRAIMAPEDPPYFFGTKRNPLEHDYYEVLDRSNVAVVDLNKTPLKTFQPKGMMMSDNTLHEFDMVVLATGFDSFTGS
jgi:cation diffusion facilitator CzcD-associated flavoprotein CzcO